MRELTSNHHLEATPGVRGGRPRLSGTRFTVADAVVMHLRLGQSLEEIAGRYDLGLAQLYAAMAYYYDHRAEIDDSIVADRTFAEAFQQSTTSIRALSTAKWERAGSVNSSAP